MKNEIMKTIETYRKLSWFEKRYAGKIINTFEKRVKFLPMCDVMKQKDRMINGLFEYFQICH